MIEAIAIRPDNIPKYWHYFADGVQVVLNNASKDMSLDLVFNNLLSGQYQLFAGYKDNKYIGFMIGYAAGEIFCVVQAYIKPDADKQIFFESMEAVEEKAKQFGCNRLRFWTMRDDAFYRRMKDKGYKRGPTEYNKELIEEAENGK